MIARPTTAWRKSPTRSVTGTRASGSSECSAIGLRQALVLIWRERLKQLMRPAWTESRLLPENREWTIDFRGKPADGWLRISHRMIRLNEKKRSHANRKQFGRPMGT